MCKRLHELGFVAYYNDAKLKDWVVTNPQKVIDAIAAVVTSAVRIRQSSPVKQLN